MTVYRRLTKRSKRRALKRSPEVAHGTTMNLMDKYFLDGRDANTYANSARVYGPWVYDQHDGGSRSMRASVTFATCQPEV